MAVDEDKLIGQAKPENQLQELRRYVQARGWSAAEYVDRGVSGTKESRPALVQLLRDAKRRRLDVVVCWRLDRLGRNLKHLITLLDELQALGVGFVSLAEGIDATTPAGKLQMHILGAIAEFERGRIVERVKAGLARAKAAGKQLGRPRVVVPQEQIAAVSHLPVTAASAQLGVSRSTVKRWRVAARRVGPNGHIESITARSQPDQASIHGAASVLGALPV
jgi:DNA invertase Pin-like site-specific DNA recombinase